MIHISLLETSYITSGKASFPSSEMACFPSQGVERYGACLKTSRSENARKFPDWGTRSGARPWSPVLEELEYLAHWRMCSHKLLNEVGWFRRPRKVYELSCVAEDDREKFKTGCFDPVAFPQQQEVGQSFHTYQPVLIAPRSPRPKSTPDKFYEAQTFASMEEPKYPISQVRKRRCSTISECLCRCETCNEQWNQHKQAVTNPQTLQPCKSKICHPRRRGL